MSIMGGADLTATVDANVQPWEKALDRAHDAAFRFETDLKQLDSDIRKLEKQLDDDANAALKRHHDALDKTGKAMLIFGAASAAALVWSTGEAIKWESAWAGVTKTTTGSAAEMAVLEDQLRDLTSILPATHEEIAGVAEAAGQLGVAREDLAAFTKTAIDLGETTDLAAEDAATAIAQMMNVMRSAPELVDKIGNTLVALGNNGASTESQILSMSQRLSGAVALIGGSEADVLGLASAMANLGIESELGGGAMSRVLLLIEKTVKGGGDKLGAFARFAGTSAEQFASAWQADPISALDMFVQAMGRSQAEGRNLIAELDSLGIKGTQNLQVMLRLAGAGTELADSLDLSRDAWETNNALVLEAEKRYATTESQIKMARNQLRDAAIDIGGVVVPALAAVVDVGTDMLQFWSDLPGPLKTAAVVFGIAMTAITLLGGAALVAVPKIHAFKVAVESLDSGKTKSAGKAVMGLGSALAGPWGLALAGATIALGIFAAKHGAAAREVDALKETLDEQTGAISANSAEWAIKKLSEEGALDAARKLGIDLGVVTDAALGQADALEIVNGAMMENADAILASAANGDIQSESLIAQAQASKILEEVLGDTNGTLADARAKWELESAAKEGSATATTAAGDAQAYTTQAWQAGADAAGDLAEDVKTLGEELEELAAGYLGQREAGREVRDTLREIRQAVREYIKETTGLKGDALDAYLKKHRQLDGSFKKGSESANEFGAMLDGLAESYLGQLDALEKNGASQKQIMELYRQSRERLLEVADQLGLTRKQAEEYVEAVLGTPAMVKTRFEQENLDAGIAKAETLETVLRRLDTMVVGPDVFVGGMVPRGGTPGTPKSPSPSPSPQPDDPRTPDGPTRRLPGDGRPRSLSGSSTSSSLTVIRESGPLIGELKVVLQGGATRADAHRVATEVMAEISLAARSSRWMED